MSGEDENGGGEVETLDESEDLETEDIVVLIDEEGEEHRFLLLAIVEVEDQDYALLAPEDQMLDEASEEYEVHIFQYDLGEDDLPHYSPVEDEQRYREVLTFCETLFEQAREDEELPEGGPEVDES